MPVAVAPNQFAYGGVRGAGFSASANGSGGTSAQQGETMKIRLKVNGKSLEVMLRESETTRDFVSLLPLTLTLLDLFGREKFGHLPRVISDFGEQTHSYQVGEVVYWSPGPDIAVFYRHDGQSIPTPGLIVIGKIGYWRLRFVMEDRGRNIVPEDDSTVATRRQMRPAFKQKDRPREGGLWIVCRELVLKLRQGLQFILGGVIHRVIGIPTLTGGGCGGCRGGSCGTGGGSRGAVWNGSSCRSIRRCGRR
jgi:hypothetical protein